MISNDKFMRSTTPHLATYFLSGGLLSVILAPFIVAFFNSTNLIPLLPMFSQGLNKISKTGSVGVIIFPIISFFIGLYFNAIEYTIFRNFFWKKVIKPLAKTMTKECKDFCEQIDEYEKKFHDIRAIEDKDKFSQFSVWIASKPEELSDRISTWLNEKLIIHLSAIIFLLFFTSILYELLFIIFTSAPLVFDLKGIVFIIGTIIAWLALIPGLVHWRLERVSKEYFLLSRFEQELK